MSGRKETVLDLAKFIDKGVQVKLTGGRQGEAEKMVKLKGTAEVVYDPSTSYARKPRPEGYAAQKRNFMSGNLADMYNPKSLDVANESDGDDVDMTKLLKDIQYLGASHMSWKERKKLENQQVVSLGGKPSKKHRTPLSVAKPAMKNQKKREQKKMEEDKILGLFQRAKSSDNTRKRKPEDRVLKATEGHFRRGVLHVKNVLAPSRSENEHVPHKQMGKWKGKGKPKGNKKGGKRRR